MSATLCESPWHSSRGCARPFGGNDVTRSIGSTAHYARRSAFLRVPTISVSSKKVTVAWTASTFTSGGGVPGYAVRRYNVTAGTLQTIGATCAGIVAASTCTENNTPIGNWQYTVPPAAGGW